MPQESDRSWVKIRTGGRHEGEMKHIRIMAVNGETD